MSSPATAPSNQESQAGIGTAPSDQAPLAPLGDAQNFKVRNVFVTPTFRPVSQEGDPIVSEVCTGFVMEVRCPFSNKPLGVVSVLIDPHAGSEVEATIQELFAPTEFGGQQFDPTHNGVHHGFVEHVLDHAPEKRLQHNFRMGKLTKGLIERLPRFDFVNYGLIV